MTYVNSYSQKENHLTELFEIELFDYLTVCKQISDIWLNCL